MLFLARNLVRFVLVSSIYLDRPVHAHDADQPITYSTWMSSSIISRNQGILTGQGDASGLLQSGITQDAFRCLIEQYPKHMSLELYASHLQKSVDSVTEYVSNATQNIMFPLDRLSNGNAMITAYQETRNKSYHKAIQALRQSIDLQKRNALGGLWYYVYPNWSYLDGMYSLGPFYAMYTKVFNASNTSPYISDIQLQFNLLWEHNYDNKTGLLFHGYDLSRTAIWANDLTGASPHVWGRSLGWYMVGLLKTLELLPASHESNEWKALRMKFERLCQALVRAVDDKSGAWWQVLDQPGREGNYIESSSTALFVYSLLKGARLGFFRDENIASPKIAYADVATRAYSHLVRQFVVVNDDQSLGWNGTVSVCSLNSTASYDYYTSRPVLYNSVLGSAAFVLASLEYEVCKGYANTRHAGIQRPSC